MHGQTGCTGGVAAARRKTRKSPSHGLAQRPNASRSVVASGPQHGPGMANSSQPPTGERKLAGCATTDLEGVCPPSRGDCRHQGQPCAEDRLAPVGNATSQRGQPLHPQGEEEMVRPCGAVSTENVLRLLEYQRYRCALTGRELAPETAALDHIVPIRCDGEHAIENTQVLHKEVNRAKGSLTNPEFIHLCREVVTHCVAREGGDS